MIKLIASDVDGTLVKDGTLAINPEYYEVIRSLQAKGIKFVACSGRSYSSLAKVFKPLKDEIMFICDGGSSIRSSREILKVYPLPEKVWKGMYRDIIEYPTLDCFAGSPDKCYAEDSAGKMYRWLRDSYGFPMYEAPCLLDIHKDDIIKFTIYNEFNCKEICQEKFIPDWQDKADITAAGKEWVDCIAKGANKGTALRWIQDLYGISPEETCVFGDNFNDIEMFKAAGTSYAVSNTYEEVKTAASNTCDPYWEDGVLSILKSFL